MSALVIITARKGELTGTYSVLSDGGCPAFISGTLPARQREIEEILGSVIRLATSNRTTGRSRGWTLTKEKS